MNKLILASTAALLFAAPASAQILGGGGGVLGGSIGGSIGGTLGGGLDNSTIDRTTSSVHGSGQGAAGGDTRVDRRKGSARASGSANGSGSSTADGTLGGLTGGLSGSGSGSANGSADAQLFGTDAVGGLASGAAGRSIFLAAEGTAAAQAAGAFAVEKGMTVRDATGEKVGKVRQVATDASGRVQALVIATKEGAATLPAANFSGSGNVLISAMQQSQVNSVAQDQNEKPATTE